MSGRPIRLAVIAGEESGDLLGADLVRALKAATGREIELVGVGGNHLAALGLKSMFDPSEIAIMGVTAILRDLPRLALRVGQTARAIARANPDCLVTIDSPEFNLRIARKVRAANPAVPIIKYVCPSVWAWWPERAPRMRAYLDHVLCLLPFEPAELKRLNGPPGTFVGHRLTHDAGILAAAAAQASKPVPQGDAEKTLLVLPGSRKAEVRGLIGAFGETLDILRARGNRVRVLLPTVPNVASLVAEGAASWQVKPEIISDPERKWRAFGEADAALAASGTVSLELALAKVPFVVCYKNDRIVRMVQSLITVWSASLPNLIADRPVVPEYYDRYVLPQRLARELETLMRDTPARASQMQGFEAVAAAMRTERPSGEIAAEVVLGYLEKSQGS